MEKTSSEFLKEQVNILLDLIDKTEKMIQIHQEAKSLQIVTQQYAEIKQRYVLELLDLIKNHYQLPLVA